MRLLGHVSEAALPGLYSAAALLAFPSLYEGFGLPALEAMACGTPVCASVTTGLGEAVGDAGLTFDPRSAEEIAECIRRLLEDDQLRATLRANGLERAATLHLAQERRGDGDRLPGRDRMTTPGSPPPPASASRSVLVQPCA